MSPSSTPLPPRLPSLSEWQRPDLPYPQDDSTNAQTASTWLQRQQQQQQQLLPKSLWRRLLDRYSLRGQQERIHCGEAMFQAATRQASDPRWFGPGRIGRAFRPRHALLTMHIWLLHKRLISDTLDKDWALMVQEELFNILWDDTTCRIRQQGVNELMVNKNLLQVQQYTFLHLTHYDHVYTEMADKPAQRLKELRKLLWQHVLVREEDAEHRHDHLDRLAWYVEANYQNIVLDWPDPYYREARVAWVDLPDFRSLRDAMTGRYLPDQDIHPEDVLPYPWLRNITLRGVEYYWNPKTMQSTWERPVVVARR